METSGLPADSLHIRGHTIDVGWIGLPVIGGLVLLYLAVLVLTIVAYAKIAHRAGYSALWILLLVVPVANVVVPLLFGFKEWPVQREVRALRYQLEQSGQQPLPPATPHGRVEG